MTVRTHLLAGAALTPIERAMGRPMRGPDHPSGDSAPAPSPSPEPSPEPSHGEQDDFSAFEAEVDKPEDDTPPADDKGDDDNSSGDDVDPATPDDDDAEKGDPPAPEEQQGASTQERIDELTAKRREAERELAEERRAKADLEARLAKLEKGDKPEESSSEKKDDPKDKRPNPDDYEFGDADSKFIADLARYETRQELKEERERRDAEATRQTMEQELKKVEDSWTERSSSEDVKTKYADFHEKVSKGADNGDWALSPFGTVLVKASEVGPDIAYHLASNPDESRRIAGLSNIEQAIELGRLEGRFLNAGDQPAAPAKKTVTSAPTPPQKRSRGTGGKYAVEADTEDFSSFDKMADGILAQQ